MHNLASASKNLFAEKRSVLAIYVYQNIPTAEVLVVEKCAVYM